MMARLNTNTSNKGVYLSSESTQTGWAFPFQFACLPSTKSTRCNLALHLAAQGMRRWIRCISCCSVAITAFLLFLSRKVSACDHDHHHQHHDNEKLQTTHRHHHPTPNDMQHLRNLTVVIDDDDYILAECGARSLSAPMLKLDQQRMKIWSAERSKNIFKRSVVKLYEIPVYAHVLQSGILSGRVPAKRLREYVDYLNDAFGGGKKNGTPFVFRLVETTWTINARWTKGCGDVGIEKEFKEKLRVGGAESLNVYFCDTISNGRGGFFAGYAYPPFPASDSFVRDGVVLAKSSGESRLNTFVHEVGHFLGLLHTFEENSCDADNPGDMVRDTPTHVVSKTILAAVNCRTNPINWDTCPGLPGRDPVDNYMTYSTDNLCRSKFTPGQVERMIAQYELYRKPAFGSTPVLRQTKKPTPSPTPAPTVAPTPAPAPAPAIPSSKAPFLSYFSFPIQTSGVGAKLPAASPPKAPVCSSVFATCVRNTDCCSEACVFMSYTGRNMCWV